MRSLILAALLFCTAAAASARDWFVNGDYGDDRNNGLTPVIEGSKNGPFLTIGRALISADKADRVILIPGGQPFRECVTLQGGRHSGIDTLPFEIVGNGAVLEGLWAVEDEAWEHVRNDVYRFTPTLRAHQTFFLNETPAMRQRPTAEGYRPLKPLEWALSDGQLYFRTEKDRMPQSYLPRGGGHQTGLTLYEVRHVKISNLTVRGFQLDGVNAHDSAFDVTLEGVTSSYNGRSGFSVQNSSRVELRGCKGEGNGVAQVRVEDYAHLHLVDNEFDETEGPALQKMGGKVTTN